MTTLLIILIAICLITIGVLLFFLIKEKKKFKELKDISNQKFSCLKNGWYKKNIKLVSNSGDTNGDSYEAIVYVEEIDRFKSGLSKIKLINVEVVSGFDQSQLNHVKNLITNKFCSLREYSDINWLESEDDIKKLRREKLEKIMNIK